MYPAELVLPMKEELTENGFTELLTPDAVEEQLKQEGTTLGDDQFSLWMFRRHRPSRSIDGCCQQPKKPDHLTTSLRVLISVLCRR